MLSFEEYVDADATAWAERVRRGEVGAAELLEAAIARAEAVQPVVNGIAARLYERARERARRGLSGPLAGVPWAMKDLFQPIAGAPLTNGSRLYAGNVGREDALLVRRYEEAGLNTFCTTTTPELAIAATTESTLYGPTRNPWDPTRIAGGSSGGAAALVAAGVLPAAHATDGGGSIRGPASCCGLFGLKPSRGRVPVAATRTEGWGGCSTTHAVTRSVRDSALLLDVAHGPEPGSRYVAPPPRGRFVDAVSRPPGRLRIAYHWETRPGVDPDPECVAAVEFTAALCQELGHEVEPAAPRLDLEALARAFGRVVLVSVAALVAARATERGVDALDDELEETTRGFVAIARTIPALALHQANDAFMEAARVVAEFQTRWDLILCPTLGRPPIPLGEATPERPLGEFDTATRALNCFTALQNQTGQPAMTVPLHWTTDGLPVGVQCAGRVGEEELLFSLAGQLEAARPWFHRRPVVPATS